MRHMPIAEPNAYGIDPAATLNPWDVTQWTERANAIADPGAMFEPLSGDGPISLAGVDAVRDVYPAMWRDTRQQIEDMAMQRAELGELLPRDVRVQLGIAFDLPHLEPTMTPDVMQATATAYAAKPEKPRGGGRSSGGGLDLAGAMDTTSDRIERGNTR